MERPNFVDLYALEPSKVDDLCDKLGPEEVRAMLRERKFGSHDEAARKWLEKYDLLEAVPLAREASKAARHQARVAYLALIVSVAAVIISILKK